MLRNRTTNLEALRCESYRYSVSTAVRYSVSVYFDGSAIRLSLLALISLAGTLDYYMCSSILVDMSVPNE